MNDNISNPLFSRADAMRLFGFFSQQLLASPHAGLWRRVMPVLKKLNYFSCPASTRYHLGCDGGLLMHSMSVTKLAINIAGESFVGVDPHDIMLAGLLHDVGKCGLLGDDGELQPLYVKNYEPFPTYIKSQKWWTAYIYTDADVSFTFRDLSALYCAKWGVPWSVIQAVLLHDGLYNGANNDYLIGNHSYTKHINQLTRLLTSADFLSSQLLEGKDQVWVKRYDR